MLNKVQMIAHNVLFPSICVLCQHHTPFSFPLCRQCLKSLPFIKQACLRCAYPLNQSLICGKCLIKPPSFDKTIACFYYARPIDGLIYQFKMKHSLYLAPFFARFIAHSVKAHYKHTRLPDCLIPMPTLKVNYLSKREKKCQRSVSNKWITPCLYRSA